MKFSEQVVVALKALHPGVRRDIRRALDDLAAGRPRDTASLSGELKGFSRLRVGRHRVIYRRDKTGEILVEYLAPRRVIYKRFKP